eukprot:scaffold143167_cov18-Tisochrysis_lutea.AAC.1
MVRDEWCQRDKGQLLFQCRPALHKLQQHQRKAPASANVQVTWQCRSTLKEHTHPQNSYLHNQLSSPVHCRLPLLV